jgi:hypothetical protein
MELPNEPHDGGWYWDLRAGRAVPASERGAADDLLGPYPTREAAEHWRERVEQRNEAWDEDDEAWGRAGDDDESEQPR